MGDIGHIISAIDETIIFFNELKEVVDNAYYNTIIATDYKDDAAKKRFFEFYEVKLKTAKAKVDIMKKFSKYIYKNYKEKSFLLFWERLGRYFDKTHKHVLKAKKRPPKNQKGVDRIIEVRDWLQFKRSIFEIIEQSVANAENMQDFLVNKETMKKL